MYRRAQGDMEPAIYTPTDDLRAILMGLQRRYGGRTPTEREEATQQRGQPWNSSEPIENMFFKLEELFIQAVVAEVPYTMVQLLDQAPDRIKKTRISTNSVTMWNTPDPNDKY